MRRMTDESDNNQIVDRALPVHGVHLDGATIRLMLQPTGIIGISSETYKAVRYIGIEIDNGRIAEIDSTLGSDGLMDFKDSILCDLDERLMKLFDL